MAAGQEEEEEERAGRKFTLGGIRAFEPDSDSDDDGEDDVAYMRQAREGFAPVDLMEQLRLRAEGGGGGAGVGVGGGGDGVASSSDLRALNTILEEVNSGKVLME